MLANKQFKLTHWSQIMTFVKLLSTANLSFTRYSGLILTTACQRCQARRAETGHTQNIAHLVGVTVLIFVRFRDRDFFLKKIVSDFVSKSITTIGTTTTKNTVKQTFISTINS